MLSKGGSDQGWEWINQIFTLKSIDEKAPEKTEDVCMLYALGEDV